MVPGWATTPKHLKGEKMNWRQAQAEEKATMEFWEDLINNEPVYFLKQYLTLDMLQQCKLKAFIQVRDKELYTKLQEIIND